MLFEDWSWEQYAAIQREEGMAEGIAEGMAKGIAQGEAKMQSEMIHTLASSMQPETIAAALKLPLHQVQVILSSTTGK